MHGDVTRSNALPSPPLPCRTATAPPSSGGLCPTTTCLGRTGGATPTCPSSTAPAGAPRAQPMLADRQPARVLTTCTCNSNGVRLFVRLCACLCVAVWGGWVGCCRLACVGHVCRCSSGLWGVLEPLWSPAPRQPLPWPTCLFSCARGPTAAAGLRNSLRTRACMRACRVDGVLGHLCNIVVEQTCVNQCTGHGACNQVSRPRRRLGGLPACLLGPRMRHV